MEYINHNHINLTKDENNPPKSSLKKGGLFKYYFGLILYI